MLCKECNYYHALSGDRLSNPNISFCEFSDVLFLEDVDDLQMEYPCKEISFREYLKKKSACAGRTAAGRYVRPKLFRELKECGVCTLKFPDGVIGECFGGRPGKAEEPEAVPVAAGSRKG